MMTQIVFTGGLGNQMFQYALYLAMRKHGRKPCINMGWVNWYAEHNGFELQRVFSLDYGFPRFYIRSKFAGGVTIFVSRHMQWLCYKQDENAFSDRVFLTRKSFVEGYWQDVRYFETAQDEVRRAFTFRGVDGFNQRLGQDMQQANSISVHIRRGDYLEQSRFLVCTPEYYECAISYMKERVEHPKFYFFSDDLDYCEALAKKTGVDYELMTHNRGEDSYKDMYLMTCCRHNIIANSSFSWWGTWLGKQEGKEVACPEIWVKDLKAHPCPDNWKRIKV